MPGKTHSKAPRSGAAFRGIADLLGIDATNVRGVASMFMQGVEAVAGPQKRMIDQIAQWSAHFSRAAMANWVTNLPGAACCMKDCGQEAILECLSCGEPVCLAHAHISHRAEGICDDCVRASVARNGRDPSEAAARRPDAAEVRQALRVLGLTGSPSWSDIWRAHRRLAAEHHPDRQRTAMARKRAEERSKKINEAFAVLRRHYERRAA